MKIALVDMLQMRIGNKNFRMGIRVDIGDWEKWVVNRNRDIRCKNWHIADVLKKRCYGIRNRRYWKDL